MHFTCSDMSEVACTSQVACSFQVIEDAKFGLNDDDMVIDIMITTYKTAVTDAASEILRKERRRK